MSASHSPSRETSVGSREPVRCCSKRALDTRPVGRSSVAAAGLTDSILDRKRIARPSRDTCGRSYHASAPDAINSGAPRTAPVASSIAIRQMPIAPPRSLAKYKNRPSADQVGVQSSAASLVTLTGAPPATATVLISRWPSVTAKNAMRFPEGDQAGWYPHSLPVITICWGAPPVAATVHSSPRVFTLYGDSKSSPPNTSLFPSGDHEGMVPNDVIRCALSPVAPITQMPSPRRANASCFPSAE